MAALSVDELLKPIPHDPGQPDGRPPCGADVEFDPLMEDLRLAAEWPEWKVGLRPAADSNADPRTIRRPPPGLRSWEDLHDACEKLLRKGMHLQAAVYYVLTSLKTGGVAGFRDGLSFLDGLLGRYWPDLYPELDARGAGLNARVNTVRMLAPPAGRDSLQIRDRLLATMLYRSHVGEFTFRDVAADRGWVQLPAGAAKPESLLVNAALAAMSDADLAETRQAAEQALDLVERIEAFFKAPEHGGRSPVFSGLAELLGQMVSALSRADGGPAGAGGTGQTGAGQTGAGQTGAGQTGAGQTGTGQNGTGQNGAGSLGGNDERAGAGGAAATAAAAGPSVPLPHGGRIQSSADVRAALQAVCDYYKAAEKSSPVKLVAEVALKLVDKDYLELFDLLPADRVNHLKSVVEAKSAADVKAAGT